MLSLSAYLLLEFLLPSMWGLSSWLLQQSAEAQDIKKRWQEYTEEQCKKDLNDPDNQDGVITLGPDILECEVKWVLRTITMKEARVRDGILKQLSYF